MYGATTYENDKGLLHREDGPAYINEGSGFKSWWVNGKRHRADGPAIEYGDGRKSWWYNGKPLDCETQEEFEQLMRLELFW